MAKRISMVCVQAALAAAIAFVPALFAIGSARAQTFTVLYTFTSTADGEQPDAPLIQDAAGNLYGTTQYGGAKGGLARCSSWILLARSTSSAASLECRMLRIRIPG
jgi:hypothetical protein